MSKRKTPDYLSTLPEKCRMCPVVLEALGDIAVDDKLCEFGMTTPEAIKASKIAFRDAGYDIIVDNDELLAQLRARTSTCIGTVTLEKTVETVRYEATICSSQEATIPLHHQSIRFEPAIVNRQQI
jgi:hypothetical protein